ncbi:hypothetical protein CUC49_11280 [Citrobacter pasteurii]|nr:hypothetical protein CUC49_11280 [Citrobacter pasteurii]NHM09941.1 hypothetical protein [Citrobacter youngae]TRL65208.1 hypothetical protein FMM65_19385 [Citrobacter youngae]
MLRNPLRLFLQATGPGAMQHPCRSHPEPASLRVLPALWIHVGNYQPDQPTPHHLRFLFKQQNRFNWKSER